MVSGTCAHLPWKPLNLNVLCSYFEVKVQAIDKGKNKAKDPDRDPNLTSDESLSSATLVGLLLVKVEIIYTSFTLALSMHKCSQRRVFTVSVIKEMWKLRKLWPVIHNAQADYCNIMHISPWLTNTIQKIQISLSVCPQVLIVYSYCVLSWANQQLAQAALMCCYWLNMFLKVT